MTNTKSDHSQEEKEIIRQFISGFKKVKEMGFVSSHRKNNTGIGKTFEDLMGIQENNIQDVDFMNLIEIKTKRLESESMLTLFTLAPTYPKKSNGYLRDTYGMVDEGGIYKKLHTTITALEYNNFGENLGFKLECNDEEERIYIRVMDKRTNTIFNDNIYYTYDKIREVISKKCANIAFVVADTRKNNDKEEFHFTSAKLLTGCTFKSFLCAVKDGRVKYDIRIGSYKSGKNKGKVHDHGSGFRIRKNEISSLFNITEL